MSRVEFLSVFIGIVFGLAVVDLIQKWRGLRKSYWEYSFWSLALFLISLVNWYSLYDRLEIIVESFGMFVLVLLVPLTFFGTVMVFTPEKEDKDTRQYFTRNRRSFFILLFLFLVVNWILVYVSQLYLTGFRIINYFVTVFILLNVFFDRVWLRTSALVFIYIVFIVNLILG